MQFQADLLGRPVRRPAMAETTALGAAMLAGLAAGVWRSPRELAALSRAGRTFRSAMRAKERERLLGGWRDAVARVRSSL
jgi:glycerol kinase